MFFRLGQPEERLVGLAGQVPCVEGVLRRIVSELHIPGEAAEGLLSGIFFPELDAALGTLCVARGHCLGLGFLPGPCQGEASGEALVEARGELQGFFIRYGSRRADHGRHAAFGEVLRQFLRRAAVEENQFEVFAPAQQRDQPSAMRHLAIAALAPQ